MTKCDQKSFEPVDAEAAAKRILENPYLHIPTWVLVAEPYAYIRSLPGLIADARALAERALADAESEKTQ